MCKKFKESSKVWTLYGLFKMKQGKPDAARAILQKSLKSLPKRKRELFLCFFFFFFSFSSLFLWGFCVLGF